MQHLTGTAGVPLWQYEGELYGRNIHEKQFPVDDNKHYFFKLMRKYSYKLFQLKKGVGGFLTDQVLHKDVKCRVWCIITIQHVWNTVFKHPVIEELNKAQST